LESLFIVSLRLEWSRMGGTPLKPGGTSHESVSSFKNRYAMVTRNDPSQLVTVTLWGSHDDFVRWTQSDVNRDIVRKPGLWASKPEPIYFGVMTE